jgi:hypothetical protein
MIHPKTIRQILNRADPNATPVKNRPLPTRRIKDPTPSKIAQKNISPAPMELSPRIINKQYPVRANPINEPISEIIAKRCMASGGSFIYISTLTNL